MREPRIEIEIEFSCSFAVDELWPDGDAPETIDREAVLALIEQEGWYRTPSAWGFDKPQVRIGFVRYDLVTGRIKHGEVRLPDKESE